MSNMSYCRFENTYRDLADCAIAMADGDKLSTSEREFRDRLLTLCQAITEDSEAIIEREAENEEADHE